jgi:hypothetical protein
VVLSIPDNPKDHSRRSVISFQSLAQEIVDNHEAVLEQFREIAADLGANVFTQEARL